MDCFLVLRGTQDARRPHGSPRRTRSRSRASSRSSREVERVIYPGLESHPQHALAKRQMKGFGGMVSFELAAASKPANALRVEHAAVHARRVLGGVESLIETPPIMTHASIPAETRRAAGLADGLVRLSVGIEHVDDLIADLAQALDRESRPRRALLGEFRAGRIRAHSAAGPVRGREPPIRTRTPLARAGPRSVMVAAPRCGPARTDGSSRRCSPSSASPAVDRPRPPIPARPRPVAASPARPPTRA
jgi:hypothetical protein